MGYDTYVSRQQKETIPNPVIPINQHCPPGVTIEVKHGKMPSELLFKEGVRFADFIYSLVPGGWTDGLRARLKALDEGQV